MSETWPRMLSEPFSPELRELKTKRLEAGLVVVGGGLAGTCAALTAARAGVPVVLVQDRPVLGGNASSEVRLWGLGATSHMGNNNRWAREGGVINEILVENLYRNPEGNALIFDTVLLEKVLDESNITLLLNTSAHVTRKQGAARIDSVQAFCSQNSTLYDLHAPLFCDASGDGVVAFQAGAAFRMGAEAGDEFGEKFAPSDEYGYLLGHSIYFYSKDVGRPVRFVPPRYALEDITAIPRFRSFNTKTDGCRLWWIEYGGRLDTVHETETIKWQLWRVVYGVWNHIKNSGEFPDADNLTLEWVGHIPGKRESRRFEGDTMMIQQDIIEQRRHADAIAFGGWSIDLHPADGVFSERPGCDQWHAPGVYQIPYRTLYARNIDNLFLGGRIMSVSHVAFGSTRVMLTLANAAQGIGMAAAHCLEADLLPRDLCEPQRMARLQRDLMRAGQHIPGLCLRDDADLVQRARVGASSKYCLEGLADDGPLWQLERSVAQMLPVRAGEAPAVDFIVDVDEPTTLRLELRGSERLGNFTPDVTLGALEVELAAGPNQVVTADFGVSVDADQYLFYCLMANAEVHAHLSEQRLSGVLALQHRRTQTPPDDIGVDRFEFWTPPRRPAGQNLAMAIRPVIDAFDPANVSNGLGRPTTTVNAWVADPGDPCPTLRLAWDAPRSIREIVLVFDSDMDHAMETTLMGHPEHVVPFTVTRWRILDGAGNLVAACDDNHQTINRVQLAEPLVTERLQLELPATAGAAPAALFGIRCYE